MALSKLTFNVGQGVGGRLLGGEDHYSGFIFPSATLPAGFSANDRIKQIFSVADAEAFGIIKGSAASGVLHYHISEYFRTAGNSTLYVYICPATLTGDEVVTLQNFAEGRLRQVGVFHNGTAFATTQVQALQTQAAALASANKRVRVLFAPEISTMTLSSLADLRTVASPNVSVVIGQDGAGEGKALYTSTTKSVSCLGAQLGMTAKAAVNESVAWVAKFNFVSGTELDVPAFGNGQLVKTQADSLLEQLDTYHYTFLKKQDGVAGSFLNFDYTATTSTDDYFAVHRGRTMDKAIRNVKTFVTPLLNSPLDINEDGTLSEDSIAYSESLVNNALEQMQAAKEISRFQVTINPAQNVLATNTLVIGIAIVPKGVAKFITTNISLVARIA